MSEIYHPSSNPSDNQSNLVRRARTGLLATGLISSLLLTLTSRAAHSQVILNEMPVTFTVVEGPVKGLTFSFAGPGTFLVGRSSRW